MKKWFSAIGNNGVFLWLIDLTLASISIFVVNIVYTRFGLTLSLWWLLGIPMICFSVFFAGRAIGVALRELHDAIVW
jgi:hypothetical protein